MAIAKVRNIYGGPGVGDEFAREMNERGRFNPGTGEMMEPGNGPIRGGEMPRDFVGECPDRRCPNCGDEPLTRWFETYEGFSYIFKYGACAEFCGNEEEKFSVVMVPRNGIFEGREQCICVKSPMITGSEADDMSFIDINVGLNGFPLATFGRVLKEVAAPCVDINDILEATLNIYRHELCKLDLGFTDLGKSTNAYSAGHISVFVTEPLVGLNDFNKFDESRLDNEGRMVITIRIPTNNAISKDGILFVAIGMEYIRQVMAAANTYITLAHTSEFKPNFYDIFSRNIRHEIANRYYPDGYMQVVKYVAALHGIDTECENNTDQN